MMVQISKYINRPISKWITSKIADYPLTPNQISIAVFFISVIIRLNNFNGGLFFSAVGCFVGTTRLLY